MAERDTPHRRPQDIGKDSPAKGEAKEQSIAGDRGGPRAPQIRGVGKQPAQTSGRRSKRHEEPPKEAKSFSPEEAPSEQGEGEPSPEQLKERSSLQGIEPRSGSHSADDELTDRGDRLG